MNILNIIFPKRCVECNKLGSYFCKTCRTKIKYTTRQICPMCEKQAIDGVTHPVCKTTYTIDGLTSFFHYDGMIQKAVKFLKYRFVFDLAEEFIDLIPIQTIGRLDNKSILVPIPLHPSRLQFRGFNQAEVLGRLIAGKLNIPVRADILKRVKKTKPQVEMKDREKRLTNMKDVFSLHQPLTTSHKQSMIFLFDDVFTTGATLRAAANVLKRAGAKNVWGIVMAHG